MKKFFRLPRLPRHSPLHIRRRLRLVKPLEEHSVSIKGVLFDFDGTVAHSLDLGYEIMGRLCEINGFTLLEREAYRTLGTREILKQMGIPLWLLAKVMRQGRRLMAHRMNEVAVIEGMPELLESLTQRGYSLGIVTSNSDRNVLSWLRFQGLEAYFSVVIGGGKLLKKERCIKKALSRMRLRTANVIYVGDESRDVHACRRLRMRMVAATWGLDTREKLEEMSPPYVADSPKEILDILSKIGKGE